MYGTLTRHPNFTSRHVAARHIDVWLPPGYRAEGTERYPVMYMHDGQNLFDPRTAFIGVDWGMDQTMGRLTVENLTRAAIVVGIWNTPQRSREYLPRKPFESARTLGLKVHLEEKYEGGPLDEAYLRFLTEELKPFMDKHYRTLQNQENTFVMGSSMGGLISLYAVCEYPQVFAGAACLSTHWPVVESIITGYLAEALPRPGRHKIYFDYGTATLDAAYESCQRQVDEVMRRAGYTEGQDWVTRKFAGAEHSERAWRERVHVPLKFLLAENRA